jgi:hypothetical protein
VPVDGGGMPAYDAAQPGGRGRRARRLLMCAVASAPWGSPRRQRAGVADHVTLTGAHGPGDRRRLMLAALSQLKGESNEQENTRCACTVSIGELAAASGVRSGLQQWRPAASEWSGANLQLLRPAARYAGGRVDIQPHYGADRSGRLAIPGNRQCSNVREHRPGHRIQADRHQLRDLGVHKGTRWPCALEYSERPVLLPYEYRPGVAMK